MHQLVVPHIVDLTHYKAGAIVFGCIDDRFYPLFEKLVAFLKAEGKHDHVDRVMFVGGAKELGGNSPAERRVLFEQIEKSVRLHHTGSIVLTTHEECGAMEWSPRLGNRDGQFLFHLAKHRGIEGEVLFRFPRFKGKTRHFYLSAHGAIELDLSQKRLSEEETHTLLLDR